MAEIGTTKVKRGLAEMFKGGVIMDVTTVDQAKIAEEAGAVSVMALERIPADIRKEGGVARSADPGLVEQIMDAVSIPVMAKVRIGHISEARILEYMGVDFIDESEVLTPADVTYHIDKWQFKIPFVCGARNLGEALRRVSEGAAMIRTKGEPGTGDVSEAVTHMRAVMNEVRKVQSMLEDELVVEAKDLGANGVFVGSGIFKSSDPLPRAKAIVAATTYWEDPKVLFEVSKGLKEGMSGIDARTLVELDKMQVRDS